MKKTTKQTPAKKAAAKPAVKTASAPIPEPKAMDDKVKERAVGVPRTNRERNAYALDTLIAEVTNLFPETSHEVSNYDGRNTALDVTFVVFDCPGLSELLSLVDVDHRVNEVIVEDGSVLISLHSNPRTQDLRDSFGLDLAWDELAEGIEFGGSL